MHRLVYGAAFVGVLALLVHAFVDEPLSGRGLFAFWVLTACFAVGTAMLVFFSRAARRGLDADLVFVLAVRTLAFAAVVWWVGHGMPVSWNENLVDATVLGVTLTLSSIGVLVVVLHVLYAAWITPMIASRGRAERLGPRAAFGQAFRRWPRAFGLLFLGTASTLLLAGGAIAITPALDGSVPWLMALFAVPFLAWNVFLAPLLLIGLDEEGSILGAVRGCAAWARRGWRAWGPAAVVHLVMLGVFVMYGVSYTETTTEVEGGPPTTTEHGVFTHHTWGATTVTTRTTTYDRSGSSWHGFFAGGYDDESEWLDAWAEAYGRGVPPAIALLAGLILALASMAVKLHIAAALRRGGTLVLLLGTLVLGACGGPEPQVNKEAQRRNAAFLAVPAGRVHLRSRPVREFGVDHGDRHGAAFERAAAEHLPAASNDDRSLRAGLQFVTGGDARLRLMLADRQSGRTLPDTPTSQERDVADPRLMYIECEVKAGEPLSVMYVRHTVDAVPAFAVVLFGSTGRPRCWPVAPTEVDGGALGSGYRIDIVVNGPHAPAEGAALTGTPRGLMWNNAWLSVSTSTWFPLTDIVSFAPTKRHRTRAGTHLRARGDFWRIDYKHEGVQIQGNGITYAMTADGEVVEDLLAWKSPVWMLQARFDPR